MKKIFACLLLLPSIALASEITCFSGKTRIYHGIVSKIKVSEDFLIFTENKTKHTIYVNADCVIIY
jgi:hypothetical protein